MKTTYWPMDVSSRQNCTRNNFTLDLSNKEAQKGENRSHIERIGDVASIQTVLSRIMCTTPKTLNMRKLCDQVALVQSLTILTDVIYAEDCRAAAGGWWQCCRLWSPGVVTRRLVITSSPQAIIFTTLYI